VRIVVTLLAVLVIVGGLAAIKGAQIKSLMAFGEKAMADGPPPEAVGVRTAELSSWEGTIGAIGSVASSKGVAITTEAPGTVTKIHFDSGRVVKAGDVLVELDTSVERAQLASALARRELAKTNFARTSGLAERGAVAPAQRDAEESQLKASAADVAALQAVIARKTVRAPFAGKLGIRSVNLGQYLNPGTPITSLESIDSVYVDFTLPQQRITDVKVGMPVRLALSGEGEAKPAVIDGQVAAIEPSIDPTTRSVKLRASAANQTEKLRPGMFIDVEVVLPEQKQHVAVPVTAVVRAPYGDSVFIVEDKKPEEPGIRQTADGKPVKTARQQFVRAGAQKGDFVAILDGVTPGQVVVSTGAFKLRNGAPVFVTEAALPDPKLDPRLKNR
jgi:membrane fusion protein (multidrug efflux system)